MQRNEATEFEEARRQLVDEIRAARQKAKDSKAVPYGMERLRPRDAATRLESMTPMERRAFVETYGEAEAMRLLRMRKGK